MDYVQSSRKIRFITAFSLLLLTFGLYFAVGNFDFINYDDLHLLVNNPHVASGLSWENIVWAFTSTDMYQWIPLTWISHMLEFQIFGMDPAGHHFTNVVFHLLNTLLLLLFLYKTTHRYWQSAFVAALFALHPLHVEPVAWVTAYKDVLSTFFIMITLLLYARYVERPGIRSYLLTLGTYVLALMAKPMMVTLPYLLLVLDYWPLHRTGSDSSFPAGPFFKERHLRRLFYEKIPFIVISSAFSVIAYFAQSEAGAVSSIQGLPLLSRAANAVVNYACYVAKTLWPAKLAVIYPLPTALPAWEVLLSCFFLIMVTLLVLWKAKSHPYLLAGWFWFLGTLVPVIGIVQIGSASMADKFTYIPLIGLFIMIAWGVPDLVGRRELTWARTALPVAAAIVLLAATIRSRDYLGYWEDNIALYTQALKVTEDNFMASNNLGAALSQQGRYDEAIRCYYDSIRAYPKFDIAYLNLGNAFRRKGDFHRAAYFYARALELNPGYREARTGLEYCQGVISRMDQAASRGHRSNGMISQPRS